MWQQCKAKHLVPQAPSPVTSLIRWSLASLFISANILFIIGFEILADLGGIFSFVFVVLVGLFSFFSPCFGFLSSSSLILDSFLFLLKFSLPTTLRLSGFLYFFGGEFSFVVLFLGTIEWSLFDPMLVKLFDMWLFCLCIWSDLFDMPLN